ncbi:MAG: hypothetical protein IIU14_08075 [Ruminococcus sp.]|nr:hypothetical protein [Ruminococcus sp.]
MKNKKLPDILFFTGISVIILGILLGVLLGFLLTEQGFNLVPAVTSWLLSVITGTGFVTVSNSLNEAKEKKKDDEEFLRLLIEQIKEEKDEK